MPNTDQETVVYSVELMPRAIKDLKGLPKAEAKNIMEKIKSLQQGLKGNIKKLTNFSPEYRLRVGSYRVLFEIEGQKLLSIVLSIEKKPIPRGNM